MLTTTISVHFNWKDLVVINIISNININVNREFCRNISPVLCAKLPIVIHTVYRWITGQFLLAVVMKCFKIIPVTWKTKILDTFSSEFRIIYQGFTTYDLICLSSDIEYNSTTFDRFIPFGNNLILLRYISYMISDSGAL